MNSQEEFKSVISIWEKLAEMWELAAADYKALGKTAAAAGCLARSFTFTRCVRDLRAITGISEPVEEPPGTIPGMYYEEHIAIQKLLKSHVATPGLWRRWFNYWSSF